MDKKIDSYNQHEIIIHKKAGMMRGERGNESEKLHHDSWNSLLCEQAVYCADFNLQSELLELVRER